MPIRVFTIPIPAFTMRRSWCSRCSDLSVHDGAVRALELPPTASVVQVAAPPVAAVAAPALDPYAASDAIARNIVEATLYSVAERLDLTPRVVRAVASAILSRLVAEGVSARRAAEVVQELEAGIDARRPPA
jgi:hypothetical protein